jgi:16S rRNA (guanine(527)-N(7))-methyltransferase RsmG
MHERPMPNVIPLTLDPKQRQPLKNLAVLLLKWNVAHNLVSRKMNLEQIIDLLWESSAFLPFLPHGAQVVDLGSGAGIPALPLAVLRPDLKITALEPREKRCVWLRFAATRLNLDVAVAQMRWAPEWDHYDLVVSRAVFPPKEFCTRVGALAPYSLQMTGEKPPGETRQAYSILRGQTDAGLILAGKGVSFNAGDASS